MIATIRQGLIAEGVHLPISKLCLWLEVPRRAVYYRPTKKASVVQERFALPIKQLIEEQPSFGYRTDVHLLRFNKNTLQRVFQLKHWQVRKRLIGFQPRVRALPSMASVPSERWAIDLCRVPTPFLLRSDNGTAWSNV